MLNLIVTNTLGKTGDDYVYFALMVLSQLTHNSKTPMTNGENFQVRTKNYYLTC